MTAAGRIPLLHTRHTLTVIGEGVSTLSAEAKVKEGSALRGLFLHGLLLELLSRSSGFRPRQKI